MADKTWARIVGGAVFELIVLDAEVVPAEHMPADLAAEMVDVTAVAPAPQQGWATTDGGKTFAAPPPAAPAVRARLATTYQLFGALTDAQRAAYPGPIKGWDQRMFSARDTPWPEGNEKIARIAEALGTSPKAWFDRVFAPAS